MHALQRREIRHPRVGWLGVVLQCGACCDLTKLGQAAAPNWSLVCVLEYLL